MHLLGAGGRGLLPGKSLHNATAKKQGALQTCQWRHQAGAPLGNTLQETACLPQAQRSQLTICLRSPPRFAIHPYYCDYKGGKKHTHTPHHHPHRACHPHSFLGSFPSCKGQRSCRSTAGSAMTGLHTPPRPGPSPGRLDGGSDPISSPRASHKGEWFSPEHPPPAPDSPLFPGNRGPAGAGVGEREDELFKNQGQEPKLVQRRSAALGAAGVAGKRT